MRTNTMSLYHSAADVFVEGFSPIVNTLARHRFLALATAAITLSAPFLFDWWHLNGSSPLRSLLTVRVFGAICATAVVSFVAEFFRRAAPSTRLIVGAWALYLGVLLAILWPGLLTPDTRALYLWAFEYPLSDWFGSFTALQYSAALQLLPHVGFFAIFQLAMWCIAMGLSDYVLRKNGAKLWVRLALQAFLMTSVAVMYEIFQLSRDVSFVIALAAHLAFQTERIFARERTSLESTVGMAISGALMCAIRLDSIVVVLASVAMVYLFAPRARHQLVAAAAVFLTLYVFFTPLSGTLAGRLRNTFGYTLSLIINPLGYIINNDFRSPDREKDLQTIDKVVSVDVIKKIQKPDEIAAYWGGAVREQSTWQERRDFMRVFLRLVVTNIDLFLEGRLITFMGATGLRERNGAYVHKDYDSSSGGGKDVSGLIAAPLFPDARANLLGFVKSSATYGGATLSGSALNFNVLPSILICIVILGFFRKAPAAASVAAVLLVKAFLMVAFAPASQHLYYLSLQVSTPFALAVLLVEMGLTNRQPKGALASVA